MAKPRTYDVVVVGGGFAGLSAALWLGRYRRSVLVISEGPSRNAKSHVLHGYPGFDGGDPGVLLRKIREETVPYGVDYAEARVHGIRKSGASFIAETNSGEFAGRRLLIATGKTDTSPDIPGFGAFEGVSAWHCPACDGYEYTGRKLVIIGWGDQIAGYAQEFLDYTSDILLLTNGHAEEVSADSRQTLSNKHIPVIDVPIRSLTAQASSRSHIKSLSMADGTTIPADGIFYSIRHEPQLDLLRSLGCDVENGSVIVNHQQETCVPGVYAAGDIAPLEELVVVACAMGAVAANNIHTSLQKY